MENASKIYVLVRKVNDQHDQGFIYFIGQFMDNPQTSTGLFLSGKNSSVGCSTYTHTKLYNVCLFVCVEVLQPSQSRAVMSSEVSLPKHTFTGQA